MKINETSHLKSHRKATANLLRSHQASAKADFTKGSHRQNQVAPARMICASNNGNFMIFVSLCTTFPTVEYHKSSAACDTTYDMSDALMPMGRWYKAVLPSVECSGLKSHCQASECTCSEKESTKNGRSTEAIPNRPSLPNMQ